MWEREHDTGHFTSLELPSRALRVSGRAAPRSLARSLHLCAHMLRATTGVRGGRGDVEEEHTQRAPPLSNNVVPAPLSCLLSTAPTTPAARSARLPQATEERAGMAAEEEEAGERRARGTARAVELVELRVSDVLCPEPSTSADTHDTEVRSLPLPWCTLHCQCNGFARNLDSAAARCRGRRRRGSDRSKRARRCSCR
jgi:hypothetical protein